MERPLKTARFGGILQIWAGLRVRKLATEAPLRFPVSKGGFWCLVFRSVLQEFGRAAAANCRETHRCTIPSGPREVMRQLPLGPMETIDTPDASRSRNQHGWSSRYTQMASSVDSSMRADSPIRRPGNGARAGRRGPYTQDFVLIKRNVIWRSPGGSPSLSGAPACRRGSMRAGAYPNADRI
jgi:hypothetical protein